MENPSLRIAWLARDHLPIRLGMGLVLTGQPGVIPAKGRNVDWLFGDG